MAQAPQTPPPLRPKHQAMVRPRLSRSAAHPEQSFELLKEFKPGIDSTVPIPIE